MVPFYGWASTASRLQSQYEETVYFLPISSQKFLVLIRSTSGGRKAERPWSHPVVLNSYINLVIMKYKLKSHVKLTQLWPLTVKCDEVSSQSIWQAYHKIVKNLFTMHICRPNDYLVEISCLTPNSVLQYCY